MSQFHAEFIRVVEVIRHLAPVMRFDAVAGECERIAQRRIDGIAGGADFVLRNCDARVIQIGIVERPGQFDKGFITIRAHALQQIAYRRIDIFADLALCPQKLIEPGGEVGFRVIQPTRHERRSLGLVIAVAAVAAAALRSAHRKALR